MPREAAVATPIEEGCVDKLAELFPNSCSIRIPVRLVTRSNGRRRLQEKTVLEFATANEILFASALPLEFEDHIRVTSSDRSLDARATVVAVAITVEVKLSPRDSRERSRIGSSNREPDLVDYHYEPVGRCRSFHQYKRNPGQKIERRIGRSMGRGAAGVSDLRRAGFAIQAWRPLRIPRAKCHRRAPRAAPSTGT